MLSHSRRTRRRLMQGAAAPAATIAGLTAFCSLISITAQSFGNSKQCT